MSKPKKFFREIGADILSWTIKSILSVALSYVSTIAYFHMLRRFSDHK